MAGQRCHCVGTVLALRHTTGPYSQRRSTDRAMKQLRRIAEARILGTADHGA